MTTIILVIIGILAIALGVFSWRFENCGTTSMPDADTLHSEKDIEEDLDSATK